MTVKSFYHFARHLSHSTVFGIIVIVSSECSDDSAQNRQSVRCSHICKSGSKIQYRPKQLFPMLMRGFRGGGGCRTPPPLENHKKIGFLSNTGQDSLKTHSQHPMLGHHRHASETPFKWRFAGGPMMAR